VIRDNSGNNKNILSYGKVTPSPSLGVKTMGSSD